jgi:hypothetical protein
MNKKLYFLLCMVVGFSIMVVSCSPVENQITKVPVEFDDLVSIFKEFREFQQPVIVNGVPDYTPNAINNRYDNIKEFQQRLAVFDISDWPVLQQVDYHLVRAEMNGMEFDYRARKPWARDPGFYLFSQRGAGPTAHGRPQVSELPLSQEDATELRVKVQAVPELLEQATNNLTEASGGLALIALHFLEEEIAMYENLGNRLEEHHSDFIPLVEQASTAVQEYGEWLETNKETMTAPVGIGVDNYNWWLKNVQLVPYTWDELLVSMTREYEQAIAALKITENSNRNLPPFKLVSSDDEYQRNWKNAERFMRQFMTENEIFTIPDYIESYNPGLWWNDPRSSDDLDFFQQCRERDMLAEVTHNYLGHNLDGLRHARDNRPIRGANRFYAMAMIRSEGVAFGLEALGTHAGMYNERPRGKEIGNIMHAFRVVRALADLKMHGNEFTLTDAIQFCYDETPYNWMLKDGHEVWYEMQTTLRHPGWHMGMVLGKIQMLNFIEDGARVRGDDFVLRDYMDEFFAAGRIPYSLIRWEITGLTDEIETLW